MTAPPPASTWNFEKGNVYLDFTIPYGGDSSNVKFNGIYRIVSGAFLTADNGRNLVLYYRDTTCKGYWIPKKEQERLKKRIRITSMKHDLRSQMMKATILTKD
ncbi:MAG: hypothetical protein F4W92_05680 [Gammaproteobacteria bacterium]|nr:hypothetical protein [Gammaproteobacteria bacterium]